MAFLFSGLMLFPVVMFLLFLFLVFASAFFSSDFATESLDSDFSFFKGVAASTGLSRVPLMIGLLVTFFVMTVFCYIISIFGYEYLRGFIQGMVSGKIIDGVYFAVDVTISFVFFVISLFIAGMIVKPLEKLFLSEHVLNLIGQTGVVRYVSGDGKSVKVVVLINSFESTISGYSESQTFKENEKVLILAKDVLKNKYLIDKV